MTAGRGVPREQMVGILSLLSFPPPPKTMRNRAKGKTTQGEAVLKGQLLCPFHLSMPTKQRSRVRYTVRSGLAPQQPCYTQGQSLLLMRPLKVPSSFNALTWTHAGEGLRQEGTISHFFMFIFVASR